MSAVESDAIHVRRMAISDVDGVFALIYKVTGQRYSRSQRALSVVRDPGGQLDLSFVAETNGQIIGFILARLEYVYMPFDEVCLVHTMVVDPEYRQRKIGSKLISELSIYCHLEDINIIRVLVRRGDNEWQSFIESQGFRPSDMTNWDKTFEPWIDG